MQSKFKVDRTEEGKRKRTFGGVTFASELELSFYKNHLIPLRNKGVIKKIELQPKFLLQDSFTKGKKRILAINYVADFGVEFSSGEYIVYDVKGLPTAEAKIKRKIFEKVFPDKELQWVTLSEIDGGWVSYDLVQKARAKRKKEKVQKGKKKL